MSSRRHLNLDEDVVAVLEIPPVESEEHLNGVINCLQLLYGELLDVEQSDLGDFLIVSRFRH